MANGDLHILGTLYRESVKQKLPTSPISGGNITPYYAGALIKIGDTDSDPLYKLQWREVNIGEKKLLICDRNILHSVSWDDLNAFGYIFGKEITIDGKQFILRSLTGGANYRTPTDGFRGGSPITNEWDSFIVNESDVVGLPKPTPTDLISNPDNINSLHNRYWNWFSMMTWTQESYEANKVNKSRRGGNAAQFWERQLSSTRNASIGWRPVLEVLYSPPELYACVNGEQRKIESTYTKINGSWREIIEVSGKTNGSWRNV